MQAKEIFNNIQRRNFSILNVLLEYIEMFKSAQYTPNILLGQIDLIITEYGCIVMPTHLMETYS